MDNFNLKDVSIDVLNRDINCLQNTNQESLDAIDVLIDLISKLKEDENNLNIDKRKLEEKINKFKDENNKLEDFIEVYNDIVKEDQHKICNKLDKFKNNMENNMNTLEKKIMDKKIIYALN